MDQLSYKQKVVIMIVVLTAMLFIALSQTIVTTALPRIIAALGDMKYYSWVFSVFLLASSVPAILIGKLSDIYGRRPFFLIGMSLFMAGSLLSGLSLNIFHLIVSRGIQGLGGGMILVASHASVGDLFVPRERARWQGLLASAFGVASLLGPALGGYIVDNAEWRWVFWIFLPVGVIAFICIYLMYPKVEKSKPQEIDPYGTPLLIVFAISLLLIVTWGGERYTWGSPAMIGLFTVLFLSAAAIIIVERRMKNPVIPLELFLNRIFAISILVGCMLGVGFFGVIMYMPILIQGVMGASAMQSGLVVMPLTLCTVIASAVSGQAVTRSGQYKKLALTGLIIMALGLLSIAYMQPNTPLLVGAFNLMVVGTGLGITLPIFALTTQNAVDHSQVGVATASFQMSRQFGGTIGVSILGIIMNQRLTSRLTSLFNSPEVTALGESEPVIADTFSSIQNVQLFLNVEEMSRIKSLLPPSMENTFVMLLESVRFSFDFALFGVFISLALVMLFAVVAALFLEEIPLRTFK